MKRSLLAFVFLLAFGSSSFASTLGVDFLLPGLLLGPGTSSVGFKFQANTAATVARLGVFDAEQDGLVGPQQVVLWDMQGNLLASTQIDNSDALQGFWRFHSLSSSVTLTAGETYFLASQGGESYTFQTSGFTVNPYITYISDSYNSTGNSIYTPLGFPASSNGITQGQGGGFFGPNLDFASVPEPNTLLLLGLGLVGLGARYRKSRD